MWQNHAVSSVREKNKNEISLIQTGWTPLHEACNHGHYNVAMILVKAGANVNARGLDDDTPLHGKIVVEIDCKWSKRKLIEFTAPFTDAAIVGQLKLVKMLVERGADPNFKNRKGKTPCDVASSAVYNFLITARGELQRKFAFLFCFFDSGKMGEGAPVQTLHS